MCLIGCTTKEEKKERGMDTANKLAHTIIKQRIGQDVLVDVDEEREVSLHSGGVNDREQAWRGIERTR